MALGLFLPLTACHRTPDSGNSPRLYETRGIVRGIAPDGRTIDIQHEDIPGFMPSMTMPFSARNSKEIGTLRTGDGVSFRLTVTEKDSWIDQVKKIPVEGIRVFESTPTPSIFTSAGGRLREGDRIPVFFLTNQNGEQITPKTFRGQPFVLTFIFTRCPMPTFCPRMSNNFAELQKAIQSGSGALAETRLLSVTIDPQFDTPAVLKEYGKHAGADPQIWNFGSADPTEIDKLAEAFAVHREREGGTISHGLTTALIDREGKIARLWRGNAWTVQEVLREIK